jgi:peroxiredoxin Q/BCP
MLNIGDKAPEFTLKDKDGKTVSLSDFAGKKVVLYFYPKDNTPGCTRQACAFAGLYGGFQKKGVEVIGISRDSVASHSRFAEKHALPFILLSDPELTAIQAYGVWQEKKLYGKSHDGRRAHDLPHRRAGQNPEGDAQGKAGYKRGGNPRAALKALEARVFRKNRICRIKRDRRNLELPGGSRFRLFCTQKGPVSPRQSRREATK